MLHIEISNTQSSFETKPWITRELANSIEAKKVSARKKIHTKKEN